MSSPGSTTASTSRTRRGNASVADQAHDDDRQQQQQQQQQQQSSADDEVEDVDDEKLPNCPVPSAVRNRPSPASLMCSFADCSQVFDDAAGLERHVKQKHQSITFRCNYPGCSAFYTLRSQLARHVSSKHVSFTHDCIFAGCSKSYQKPSQLHAHLQQKHNASAYQCSFSECGKLFLTHVGLRNHVASKHPAITFRCVSCSQVFVTAAELHAHSVRLHAAPSSDDVFDAKSPFSDAVDEVTSSANESSAKRSRSPSIAAVKKRGRSPALILPSAGDSGASSSLPSLAAVPQAPFVIRTGGVKRSYHGELVGSGVAGGGGPTVVASAAQSGSGAGPSSAGGSIVGAGVAVSASAGGAAGGAGGGGNASSGAGGGGAGGAQPVQHVSGPRALYSSPVPQQPLTRSSRQ